MTQRRRMWWILLIVLAALALAACGGGNDRDDANDDAAPDPPPAEESAVEDAAAEDAPEEAEPVEDEVADQPPAEPVAASGQTPADICAEATADLAEPDTRQFDAADYVLTEGVDYGAVICTEGGPILLDLYEEQTPETVNNFAFLAGEGYYNNTTFHRVLPGFMLQGGDPTGTGAGDPGYSFDDEIVDDLVFDRPGLLAMANSGANTNGGQFFITYAATDWLNGMHTIFGEVLQGIEVAELLTARNPDQGPTYEGDALETVVIVEDPASLSYTPDGPPGIDHIQAVLEQHVAERMTSRLTIEPDYSHTYDAEAEAASWQSDGGDELVAYLDDYLVEQGFLGTAAVLLTVDECPENPDEFPFWAIGFQVSDYGTAEQAEAVLQDEERAETFVETGAFESQSVYEPLGGRVFDRAVPEGDWCAVEGGYRRLEFPFGRYILVADLIYDATVINDTTEPSVEQYMVFLSQDLLFQNIGGVLDRGNPVVAAADVDEAAEADESTE